MPEPIERNLGEQPIAKLLAALGLKAQDLVAASGEGLTHKMVARACKGRWLTPNTRGKVQRALHRAAGRTYGPEELFNYADHPPVTGSGSDTAGSAATPGPSSSTPPG